MDILSLYIEHMKISAILMTFFPTIISSIFYYVDRARLYHSGSVIERYPVGVQSRYEWIMIVFSVGVLSYIAWIDMSQQITTMIALLILYIGVFKEAHNKIILTEGGIYIQGKYFDWTEVKQFIKTDEDYLKFEGTRLVTREFKIKNIDEIDELVMIGNSCISRSNRE